jgi:hypothetical protein
MERPLTRTALPQPTHQEAVRQPDQVNVPGLALDITQRTVAEAELLPRTIRLTSQGIRFDNQDLAGLVIVSVPLSRKYSTPCRRSVSRPPADPDRPIQN